MLRHALKSRRWPWQYALAPAASHFEHEKPLTCQLSLLNYSPLS